MAKTSKTKAPALVVVPQNREGAAAQLRELGDTNRKLARLEADMNDELGAVKERYGAQAAPIAAYAETLKTGLNTWCSANREAICAKGTKTADLGTGKVSWRLTPPKVTIRGAEAVLDACKRLGLQRFIRTKEEPNKEAMLAEPDFARTVAGVSIGSEGEEFIAEPFEAELVAGAA